MNRLKKIVTPVVAVFLLALALGSSVWADNGAVLFEGILLPSGMTGIDGVACARLSEIAAAEGFCLQQEPETGETSFPWRLGTVAVQPDSAAVQVPEAERTLDVPVRKTEDGSDLLVPVLSFCDALEIGTWQDEDTGALYCTAGAGDWELPGGYNVAVMMYHGTGHADAGSNLVMPPEMLEEQLQYITENGYTTVGFEDLWNVENIEKPVILIFDDGWSNNYRNLFPLLKKYNCKATVAVVEAFTDESSHVHLTSEEIREMSESGYVSIQSHTATHCFLGEENEETQRYEMEESKRFITRLTGKEPFVLVYPTGSQNSTTLKIITDYYRFGVKMLGKVWNTSDDPLMIYRFFPENNTYINIYAKWLESAFPDEG